MLGQGKPKYVFSSSTIAFKFFRMYVIHERKKWNTIFFINFDVKIVRVKKVCEWFPTSKVLLDFSYFGTPEIKIWNNFFLFHHFSFLFLCFVFTKAYEVIRKIFSLLDLDFLLNFDIVISFEQIKFVDGLRFIVSWYEWRDSYRPIFSLRVVCFDKFPEDSVGTMLNFWFVTSGTFRIFEQVTDEQSGCDFHSSLLRINGKSIFTKRSMR